MAKATSQHRGVLVGSAMLVGRKSVGLLVGSAMLVGRKSVGLLVRSAILVVRKSGIPHSDSHVDT